MSAALILGAMDLAIAALRAIPQAQQAYREWRTELEAMQQEGREPTVADLERFTKRIASARQELRTDRPPPSRIKRNIPPKA